MSGICQLYAVLKSGDRNERSKLGRKVILIHFDLSIHLSMSKKRKLTLRKVRDRNRKH